MTPQEAARVLSCWLCGGLVHAMASKPWRFWCPACEMAIRPGDVGELQHAIARREAMADG
jgi:hypothetical protein